MKYNWQQNDWPEFRYDLSGLEGDLVSFADKAGQVKGTMQGLSGDARSEALVDTMVTEAIQTSKIEGEYLSRPDVASSVRKHLGMATIDTRSPGRSAEGAARLMIDVRRTWDDSLTAETLFEWHSYVMGGRSDLAVGSWRTHEEPMLIVSGSAGDPNVHFQAPPSSMVEEEMKSFITWFNASRSTDIVGLVRAALAHLYFESVHPFEDGNGRVGRAIAEKVLSQGLGRPALLSLSRTIEQERATYYEALQTAQSGNEITPWIRYFVGVAVRAQEQTVELVDFVLRKTKFFDLHRNDLNDRQLRVIKRMLEEGPAGFEGGMSARKYIAITGASKATATRDLQALRDTGIFMEIGSGRSTRYDLTI